MDNCTSQNCSSQEHNHPASSSCRFLCFCKTLQFYLSSYGAPFATLVARLYIAQIFWKSGMAKISDWTSTLYLFEHDYHVSLFSPEWAAYTSTAIELGGAALLAVGFIARLSALSLFALTVVIQFSYSTLEIHTAWLIILGMLATYGPGNLSLDSAICRYLQK
jgi:putative oxidoreductase